MSDVRAIVRPTTTEHRYAETRMFTTAFSVLKAISLAGVIFPAFAVLVDHFVITAIAAVPVVVAVRVGARRLRWRFEDRADAATAAAWRAEHWAPNRVPLVAVPEIGPAPAPEVGRAA